MSLTVEGALVLVGFRANHGTAHATVDVGRQFGVGKGIFTIYECGELFEVGRSTNLVDSIHVGKSPRSCADNTQQCGQTQI